MAEAAAIVGLVGSIASLVEFGGIVMARIIDYQRTMDEAPKVFKNIETNLPIIVDTLKHISQNAVMGNLGDDSKRALAPVIVNCHAQVKELNDLLSNLLPLSTDTKMRRSIKAVLSLGQEREVDRVFDQLTKSLFILSSHASTVSDKTKGPAQQTKSFFNVPFDRDPKFLDRVEIMSHLQSILGTHQKAILAGLGGAGKSQIAIEYCYRYREQNPHAHVIWQHIGTVQRALMGWSLLARQLAIPGHESPNANPFELVQEFLSDSQKIPWLLVLDSADDEDVILKADACFTSHDSARPRNLVSWLPKSGNGQILITTRDRRVGEKLGDSAQVMTVAGLTTEDALTMLQSRIPEESWDSQEASTLVQKLNNIPLAVTQAAAFISQNSTSVSAYLESLSSEADEIKELLQEEHYDIRRDQDLQAPILGTWKISFDLILEKKPRAVELLSLMSVMDGQTIPKSLLLRANESNLRFTTAIGVLQAFSFVFASDRGSTFNMHRLVQLSVQDWLERNDKMAATQAEALTNLIRDFPPSGAYEDWKTCQLLLPSTAGALQYQFETSEMQLHQCRLCSAVACYDREQGRLDESHRKLLKVLRNLQDIVGRGHREVADCWDNLGHVEVVSSKYSTAVNSYRKAFEVRSQLLGEDHPETLQSLSYMGGASWRQGDYRAARDTHQKAWKAREKTLGSSHPVTLVSLVDLAVAYESLGEWTKAEEMHRQAVTTSRDALGKYHEVMMENLHRLACYLENRGRHEEAEVIFKDVYKLRLKAHGKEHPLTLSSLESVGGSLYWQKKYNEAESVARDILSARQRILSSNHPETLRSQQVLAANLLCMGEYEQAETLYRHLTVQYSQSQSANHLSTLESMNGVSQALFKQGKYLASEEIQILVLAGMTKNLGSTHPHTLQAMDELTGILLAQQKYTPAIDLQRRTLDIRRQELGPTHPETLNSMDSLIGSLWGQQQLVPATELLRDALSLRKDRFGEDDAETLIRMTRLAYLVRIQALRDEAIQLYQEALSIYERTLGTDYETTRECRESLEETLIEQLAKATV